MSREPGPSLEAPGPDGVAHLVASDGAGPAEGFSLESLHRLDDLLDTVEAWAATGSARALVVRLGSGAGPTDIDLEQVCRLGDAEAARVWAAEGQRVLGRLAGLEIPALAVVDGRCLSGGLQIALACHRIVATRRDRTRLGFPELRWGLVPAWGGVTRMVRRAGLGCALVALRGRTLSVRRAAALGLVDRLIAPGPARSRLNRLALELAEAGATSRRRRVRLATRLLEETAPGRRVLLRRAVRRARRDGRYPGPIAARAFSLALDVLALPFAAALVRERDVLAELLREEPSRALLYHLGLERAGPRAAGRRPRRVAVVGASDDGVALATRLAGAGLTVRLKDARREAATRAVQRVRAGLLSRAAASQVTEAEAERIARRVSGTTGYGGFGRVDAVLLTEGDAASGAVPSLADLERHVQDGCVLLVATPWGGVTAGQQALRDPGRAAGLHLCAVGRRGGVAEVVRGAASDTAALDTAHALARALRAHAVETADRPGLVAWRLLVPYLNEALYLMLEGQPQHVIDDAARAYGLAAPPLQLLRELGPDRFVAFAERLAHHAGERFRPPPAPAGPLPSAGPTPGPAERLRGWRSRLRGAGRSRPAVATAGEIQERLLLVMVNEAARLLDERVVDSARDVDRVASVVPGFPARLGGLLFHADRQGVHGIARRLDRLTERHGSRFRPAAPLLVRAAHGLRFGGPRTLAPPARAAAGSAGHATAGLLT